MENKGSIEDAIDVNGHFRMVCEKCRTTASIDATRNITAITYVKKGSITVEKKEIVPYVNLRSYMHWCGGCHDFLETDLKTTKKGRWTYVNFTPIPPKEPSGGVILPQNNPFRVQKEAALALS